MADTTEAVEYLTAFAALVERPPRDDLQVDAEVGDKVATHLRTLLSERTALLERVERAERERDEARAGERNMAEHARRVADDANEAFAAAEALDEFWEACGYPGNRGRLAPAEQVASIIRERDEAEKIAQAAETKLATLTEALEAVADALHRIMRVAEMSSGIMLDKRRTGGWPGARKTADAFDRIGLKAAEAKAAAKAALSTDPKAPNASSD